MKKVLYILFLFLIFSNFALADIQKKSANLKESVISSQKEKYSELNLTQEQREFLGFIEKEKRNELFSITSKIKRKNMELEALILSEVSPDDFSLKLKALEGDISKLCQDAINARKKSEEKFTAILDDKQKEIYTAVLKAFLNCYHSEAKSGEQMDKIARKILKPYEKQGFLFPHALGHGIGIPVHQSPPTISSYGARKFPLYNNMTHTIEPGLYCEKKPHKFGVRLENTVYVTSLGKRNSFSHFEFEENLIEKKMLTKRELKWLNAWQNEWRELCENNFEQ